MWVLLVRITFVMGVLVMAITDIKMGIVMLTGRGLFVVVGRFFMNVMSATTCHGVPKHRDHGQNGCGGSHVDPLNYLS